MPRTLTLGVLQTAYGTDLADNIARTAAELGVQDPLDPRQNVEGGVKYLRKMLDAFGGATAQAERVASAFAAALPLGLILPKHLKVPAAMRERL